ncbi:MAG: protein phosphatase 2C domain-containing protein [Candidatus Nanopelagicales bacterium]|nr:protein phosphatase 2C domain-containing protein [Candidatus Nanopelagicales bacterium]
MTQSLYFRAAGRSDVGLVRENNEDSGFIGKNFLLVADGMGGHAAGELASSTAVSVVAQLESNLDKISDIDKKLFNIPSVISKELKNTISKDSTRSGMGTTLTTVVLHDNSLRVVHVGDSRAYLIRDKQIKAITKDQSYIQSLIDNNEITLEEAKTHPQRSLLLQAIDGLTEATAFIDSVEVIAGDKLVLCSDGLTNVVSDQEILQIVNQFEYVGAVSALIEKSLENGGPDNITVIVAEVVSEKYENKIVVLGAAAEPRNRIKLPGLEFPTDIHPFITSEFPALKSVTWVKKFVYIFVSALIAILVGWYSTNWISKQYYVSNLGDNLAIFQGLNSSIGPVSLSRPVQSFDLDVIVLTKADQQLLRAGIGADSLTEARFIVRRLDQRALCSKDYSYSFCKDVTSSIKPE